MAQSPSSTSYIASKSGTKLTPATTKSSTTNSTTNSSTNHSTNSTTNPPITTPRSASHSAISNASPQALTSKISKLTDKKSLISPQTVTASGGQTFQLRQASHRSSNASKSISSPRQTHHIHNFKHGLSSESTRLDTRIPGIRSNHIIQSSKSPLNSPRYSSSKPPTPRTNSSLTTPRSGSSTPRSTSSLSSRRMEAKNSTDLALLDTNDLSSTTPRRSLGAIPEIFIENTSSQAPVQETTDSLCDLGKVFSNNHFSSHSRIACQQFQRQTAQTSVTEGDDYISKIDDESIKSHETGFELNGFHERLESLPEAYRHDLRSTTQRPIHETNDIQDFQPVAVRLSRHEIESLVQKAIERLGPTIERQYNPLHSHFIGRITRLWRSALENERTIHPQFPPSPRTRNRVDVHFQEALKVRRELRREHPIHEDLVISRMLAIARSTG
eukprot:TRINITY_DN11431_c0_g2_i1.p1 TRINITY_DN11431_c0_g2~~TRINITY_DN11431_c0_g2_i1.p1  ORF type:complete len:459 (-),score=67.42 TRINITY_DN11431_c0_g2_i1:135-1460(-)